METTPRSDARCEAQECNRVVHLGTFCSRHYKAQQRALRQESPEAAEVFAARFWSKVQPTGFCWEWTAARDAAGYGTFYVGGGPDRAHRIAYELLVGPIPEGRAIDHLCRNRGCCNPDHLEVVTGAENTRRGFAPGLVTAREDVCRKGHSMADAYVRPDGGGRQCATCIRLRTAKATAKRKAARAQA